MASRALTIEWLRGLAEEGGKGVVNNIDARSLGRIARDLEQMEKTLQVARLMIAGEIVEHAVIDTQTRQSLGDALDAAVGGGSHG